MNRLKSTVLTAMPAVWSSTVLITVLRLLSRGFFSPAEPLASLDPDDEGAYAGKVDSRKSCQRKLGGVESREKRAYWKTGMKSMIRGVWGVLKCQKEFGMTAGWIPMLWRKLTLDWWAVMAWARTLEMADMIAVWIVAETIGGAMAGFTSKFSCRN